MHLKEKWSKFKEKNQNKPWFIFASQFFKSIAKNEITGSGAKLTYYFILSIFPFLIFLLSIISFTPLVGEEVIITLIAILPNEAKSVVSGIVNELVASRSETLLSTSFILTLWTGSLGITGLFRSINKAYNVEETRPFWKHKLLSVIFTIALAALIIIVLLTLVFGEIIANQIFIYLGAQDFFYQFWHFMRIIVPLLSLITTFVGLYIIAPSTSKGNRIKLRYALPGAIFTSIGWIIASIVFSFYVRNFSNYTATYGSLGGIIVLLLWLNLTNMIIVIGAEVNGAYRKMDEIIKQL